MNFDENENEAYFAQHDCFFQDHVSEGTIENCKSSTSNMRERKRSILACLSHFVRTVACFFGHVLIFGVHFPSPFLHVVCCLFTSRNFWNKLCYLNPCCVFPQSVEG